MLKWEDLPVEMKSSEVESYYQLVSKRKGSLIFKRCLDGFWPWSYWF
ncbi:bacterial sugar transferase family domain protein [Streptococcus pneumoniae 2081074]|nr:bacterial sugar transferase family domain protein [Streptococcus pneumoniae 2081074]